MNTTTMMKCLSCEQERRESEFICPHCITHAFTSHAQAQKQLTKERDALVATAAASLSTLHPARRRRADVAALRDRLDDIQSNARILRHNNELTRERIHALRNTLATRRHLLDDAYRAIHPPPPPRTPTPTPPGAHPPPSSPPSPLLPSSTDATTDALNQAARAHARLQDALARARQGLVQELVDVFSIVEVGGRPAAGVRAATRGEWSIAGLVLPVPGDIRRYPPTHINAALTFTIHFLGLLTYYLAVRLPFQVMWSGGKLGVGIPEIWAVKGAEAGGWAKWTVRNPLHLPLSSSSSTTSGSPPSSPTMPTTTTSPHPPAAPHMTASTRLDSLSTSTTAAHTSSASPTHAASFSTGFTMLLYSVAYLAHTQGADIPLAGAAAGEVLRNLWDVCCSAELGCRSHSTHPLLPPPTPPSFTLDFRQLLQATAVDSTSAAAGAPTAAAARSRRRRHEPRVRIVEEEEGEEGWEVVDEIGGY